MINFLHTDSSVRFGLTGEIDLATIGPIRERLDRVCAAIGPPHSLVIDLDGVTFCGTTGLLLLVRADQRCRARGVPVHVIATRRPVRRLLLRTGLTRVLALETGEPGDGTPVPYPRHEPPPDCG